MRSSMGFRMGVGDSIKELRLLASWFAEVLIPAICALVLSVFLSALFFLSYGLVPSLKWACFYFLAGWFGLMLLFSGRVLVKFRVWRELRSVPHERRSWEAAQSKFQAEWKRRNKKKRRSPTHPL